MFVGVKPNALYCTQLLSVYKVIFTFKAQRSKHCYHYTIQNQYFPLHFSYSNCTCFNVNTTLWLVPPLNQMFASCLSV